ncbi:hypothetical protein QBC37DRAFT_458867 [Rhypophila decipiens]|uniref:DUF6604 domain-containing protein n=1 Tax=Rhypophila decipiens TaxID=261697 RepID=A0AAN6XT78_9PEZI|nr:hypothetical protein QBC37DRAFT_458867 [Rhypophila decipiens]
MVYCFFDDFNAIRNYVAERWCDYWYDRSVSLTTLAVITNAAFELVNRMEGELIANLGPRRRELSRYDFMLRLLFIDFGIDHVDYDSYEGLSKDEEQERIWREESDWLAFSSFCAIVPIVYGANDMNSWKKFSDNVSLQLVKEAAHLKALKKNGQEFPILPAEPEILLDFQSALNSRMYTSALIFSVQLWPILMTHVPGKDSREGYKLREQVRERITEISAYMMNDCQYEDAKARLMQLGVEEDPEKFLLLKNEPVWAGLMNFRLQLIRSELGHQYTALTSIVEAAGYLYLACRAADKALPAWGEMDRYIDTYTDRSQFKSTLRSCATPESIIRKFEKVMTAHQAAVKEWENPNITEGTFIPDVRIRRTLYRRYAWEDPSDRCSMRYLMELTVHKLQIERNDFEEMLREQQAGKGWTRAIEEGTCSRKGQGQSGELVKQDKTVASSSQDGELAKERDFKRRAMLAQLSHVEMLQLLDETVTSQLEGLFKLDYFKLYDEAVAFLRAVVYHDAFGHELKERVGYSKFDDKTTGQLGKVPVHLVKNLDEEKESGTVVDTLINVFKDSLEGLFPIIPEEMKKKLESGGGARVWYQDIRKVLSKFGLSPEPHFTFIFLFGTKITKITKRDSSSLSRHLTIHLQDWLESDEVEPYWNEFRESWLEKRKVSAAVDKATCCLGSFAGPSRQDYNRVKKRVGRIIPSFDDVVKALNDMVVAPPAANMRLLTLAPYFRVPGRLNKAKWRTEDHWARFIRQVAFRAHWKTGRTGDGVRADDGELPSLWPAAYEKPTRNDRKALYRLLRCWTLRYYYQRTDEKSAREYRERDLLGWD